MVLMDYETMRKMAQTKVMLEFNFRLEAWQ